MDILSIPDVISSSIPVIISRAAVEHHAALYARWATACEIFLASSFCPVGLFSQQLGEYLGRGLGPRFELQELTQRGESTTQWADKELQEVNAIANQLELVRKLRNM